MRIGLIAVGRARRGPMLAMYEDYAERIVPRLELKEVDVRGRFDGDALKRREADLIRGQIPPGATVIALDERGQVSTSRDFARTLATERDTGTRDLLFVIGGAGGLDPAVRNAARHVIALGRMTWPHMLVRVMLAEQIYRAQQINAGHPYHRD